MNFVEKGAARPSIRRSRDATDRGAAIVEAVRTAITEQRLLPGTKLPEDQLGGIFGASRTLVRAALQSLARDGIVVLARNKGASVASPTVAEARALFDARRVVEAALVGRAAMRADAAMLDKLEAVVNDGHAALARQDRGRAIRLSGEFHLALAGMAEQPVLHAFLGDLVARSSLVITLYGHTVSSECGDAEHRNLVAILRQGNATAAVAAMLHHLDHIEQDLDFIRPQERPLPLSEILGLAPSI